MGCQVGWYNKACTPYSSFIVTPSLEEWTRLQRDLLPMNTEQNACLNHLQKKLLISN